MSSGRLGVGKDPLLLEVGGKHALLHVLPAIGERAEGLDRRQWWRVGLEVPA